MSWDPWEIAASALADLRQLRVSMPPEKSPDRIEARFANVEEALRRLAWGPDAVLGNGAKQVLSNVRRERGDS